MTNGTLEVVRGREMRETFPQVIERLEREQAGKVDLVLGTARPNLEMVLPVSDGIAEPRLQFGPTVPEVGGMEMEITTHAHRQIADVHKIGWNLYDRFRGHHPDLLAHMMNTLWFREPKQRLVRTLHNGVSRARAWLSPSYRVVDNLPFLKAALLEAEKHDCSVLSAHVDETRLYVKLVTPKVHAIKVGDPVQAGVIIRNSEVGDGKIEASPFIHVLNCTNGAVGTKNYTRIHLGSAQDEGVQSRETQEKESAFIYSAIQDWVRFALDGENVEEMLAQFRRAETVKVEAPAKLAIANVVRVGGLGKTEGDAVLERYLRSNNDTQRTVVDVVTHYAHSGDTSYRRQVELEELGGRLLEMDSTQFTRLVENRLSDKELAAAFSAN